MGETFKFGDSLWDLVRKILGWMSEISGGVIPSLDGVIAQLTDVNTKLAVLEASTGAASGAATAGTDLVCAVAGTAVQGSAQAATRGVLVTARFGNTGAVYIGGSTVTNAGGTKRGLILLQAGMSSEFIPVNNLNKLWINADTSGDGAGVIVV